MTLLNRRQLIKSAALSLPALSLARLFGPAQTQTTGQAATETRSNLGIILVGASWCPYCHAAAKQLGTASAQWGWPILVAALDNIAIPPFEHVIDAANHPLTAQINRLPTTLVVEPNADRIVTAFEGFRGPVPYLSQIANTIDAWEAESKGGAAHG